MVAMLCRTAGQSRVRSHGASYFRNLVNTTNTAGELSLEMDQSKAWKFVEDLIDRRTYPRERRALYTLILTTFGPLPSPLFPLSDSTFAVTLDLFIVLVPWCLGALVLDLFSIQVMIPIHYLLTSISRSKYSLRTSSYSS